MVMASSTKSRIHNFDDNEKPEKEIKVNFPAHSALVNSIKAARPHSPNRLTSETESFIVEGPYDTLRGYSGITVYSEKDSKNSHFVLISEVVRHNKAGSLLATERTKMYYFVG